MVGGCSTTSKNVAQILKNPPDGKTSKVIPDVPFVEQEAAQCGPATLAMVFHYYGKPISVAELLGQVYSKENEGALKSNMIAAARRRGLMAVKIRGYESLFREINSDHPVIVFQNVGLSWYPQWHYAVVVGYDLKNRHVYIHSGSDANYKEDLNMFDEAWRLGDYWGLVIFQPHQISEGADELEHVSSAAQLESLGNMAEAKVAYTTILKRWPDSLGALIGLGNIYYAAGDLKKAEESLSQAIQKHPESKAAQHNLAVIQQKLKTLNK